MLNSSCAKVDPQRRLAGSGATLILVGLATGIWSAAALTGTVTLTMPRLALIAHLNALLGGFWLLGVSYSMAFLYYGEKQKCRLACLVQIPTWGNWLITLIASVLGVNGLTYTGDARNNAVAFALQLVVVVPSLGAGVYWVRGFCSQAAGASGA